MNVLGLDHINISGSGALIENCRRFYVEILGLREGPRPPFRSRGFWLYAGDQAIVHLSEKTRQTAVRDDHALDHCALHCKGLRETIQRLEANGVAYTLKEVPGSGDAQIFVSDPGGLRLELNFRGGE